MYTLEQSNSVFTLYSLLRQYQTQLKIEIYCNHNEEEKQGDPVNEPASGQGDEPSTGRRGRQELWRPAHNHSQQELLIYIKELLRFLQKMVIEDNLKSIYIMLQPKFDTKIVPFKRYGTAVRKGIKVLITPSWPVFLSAFIGQVLSNAEGEQLQVIECMNRSLLWVNHFSQLRIRLDERARMS